MIDLIEFYRIWNKIDSIEIPSGILPVWIEQFHKTALNFFHFAGLSAVFSWQQIFWDEFIQCVGIRFVEMKLKMNHGKKYMWLLMSDRLIHICLLYLVQQQQGLWNLWTNSNKWPWTWNLWTKCVGVKKKSVLSKIA